MGATEFANVPSPFSFLFLKASQKARGKVVSCHVLVAVVNSHNLDFTYVVPLLKGWLIMQI